MGRDLNELLDAARSTGSPRKVCHAEGAAEPKGRQGEKNRGQPEMHHLYRRVDLHTCHDEAEEHLGDDHGEDAPGNFSREKLRWIR
jgi:hypothetical protein